MMHKSLRNKRIQQAYNDGKLTIVEKKPREDEFGTPIPGDPELKELGFYFFRTKGIHSQDRIEFGNSGIKVEEEVVIPMNRYIDSGMTAIFNDDETILYNIVKVYQNVNNDETEILLAKEGGQYHSQTKN